jgi:flagellar motor switch protein FliM
MEKILSQDEINALFSTMSADGTVLGTSSAKGIGQGRQVTSYDFCRSDRISKDQIRSIHALHSYFARNLSSSLSAYIRAIIEVNLVSVDQISYAEFLKLLSDPTLFCAIEMKPLHGNIAMEMSPSLVFPMIDMLLGGPGNAPPENRTLTEIEMNIVEGIINIALGDLQEAWRPVMELTPSLAGTETKPQMLQIVAPGEAIVAVIFEVRLGENTGMLNFCIPSVTLKMNRTKFDQQPHPRGPASGLDDAERIHQLIRGASLRLTGAIHESSLLVEDLLNLAVGDIVQLSRRVTDPVILSVAGIPKYSGRITVHQGKKAFEITQKSNF